MAGHKVRTYRELQNRIEALPPPKPGWVRVYRGQNENYKLLPSGRRRTIPRADIWEHYVRRIVTSLEGMSRSGDVVSEIDAALLWIPALAQHYGAGSDYLDVTHDLGIAVWFAFHRSEMSEIEIPPDTSERDLPFRTSWCRLSPHRGPGYIYAFDLKPWSNDDLPMSGELVDLAQAPAAFHSPRVEVQAGCLVYAEEDENLAQFLVEGTPIVMESGFDTCPYADWSVERVFPPPASDAWYARLLSLPFLLGEDHKQKDLALTQSLPVSLFLASDNGSYEADIRRHFRTFSPVLVHPHVHTGSEDEEAEDEVQAALEQATILVLEGPQISAHPPAEDTTWHHGLLMSDWSSEVDTFDVAGKHTANRVRLDSVFIEFSPLEHTGWEEADIEDGKLRALWLLRHQDDTLVFYFLFQDPDGFIPGKALLVRFNPRRGRLECRIDDENSVWEDITVLGGAANPILSCLVLLRDLSPVPKAAAYPKDDISVPSIPGSPSTPSDTTYHVVVSSSAARLVRTTDDDSVPHWYVVRHPSGEPYTTARAEGYVTISTTGPFASLDVNDVRRAVFSRPH